MSSENDFGDHAFRTKENLGDSYEATYAGALSFCRRRYSRDLNDVDIAVSGVPLDLATTYRPGTRFGPAGVRAASVQLAESIAFPWNFNPFETMAVIDYGDCYFNPGFPAKITPAITDHIRKIVSAGAMPLTIGGDHYVTYPILEAIHEKHGKVSLIHFDAHQDTWNDDGQPLNHGTMFTRAVANGFVDPERSVQIGIRTVADDTRGFNILNAPWVHRNGVQAVIDKALEIVGDNKTYLTFDIDCIDPAFAPGTGTPVAGGLSTAQALEIVRNLKGVNFVGMDVVEVSPPYDHADVTSIAGATLAYDWICLMASQR